MELTQVLSTFNGSPTFSVIMIFFFLRCYKGNRKSSITKTAVILGRALWNWIKWNQVIFSDIYVNISSSGMKISHFHEDILLPHHSISFPHRGMGYDMFYDTLLYSKEFLFGVIHILRYTVDSFPCQTFYLFSNESIWTPKTHHNDSQQSLPFGWVFRVQLSRRQTQALIKIYCIIVMIPSSMTKCSLFLSFCFPSMILMC